MKIILYILCIILCINNTSYSADGVITADGIEIKKEINPKSETIGKLKMGDRVKILAEQEFEGKKFVQISTTDEVGNQITGWVKKGDVQQEEQWQKLSKDEPQVTLPIQEEEKPKEEIKTNYNKIAIITFYSTKLNKKASEIIKGLSNFISKKTTLALFDTKKSEKALKELKINNIAGLTSDALNKLGQKLKIDTIISAKIDQEEEKFSIECALFDLKTAEKIANENTILYPEDNVVEEAESVAGILFSNTEYLKQKDLLE
jgi:hypothetical protein